MAIRFEYFEDENQNQVLRKIDSILRGQTGVVVSQRERVTGEEWNIFLQYLGENIMTEEKCMKEYNSGVETGKEQERNCIANILRKKAAELFIAGKDEEARRLRDTINDIVKS